MYKIIFFNISDWPLFVNYCCGAESSLESSELLKSFSA